MIRAASLDDLNALVAFERQTFAGDRLSRRSFRRFLSAATAIALVDVEAGQLRGYALVLLRRGSKQARLYSIASAAAFRGRGVSRALLAAAESAASSHGALAMTLEVRADNTPARALYLQSGYRVTGVRADYYEDHMEAVRMRKSLGTDDG